MTETMVVAIISGMCVAIPSIIASVMTNNKNKLLLEYKIDELTKRVEKHNGMVERTYKIENDLKTAFTRIDNLREHIKK